MIRAVLHLVGLTLRLNARNRLALVYGFLFPLLFLLAFAAIYRHDEPPLLLHLGELLTVTLLGGACFGLPTQLVAEREAGVWRRWRLAPLPTGAFLAAALLARAVLLAAAVAIQLAAAFALGMPAPADPFGLAIACVAAAVALLGLGLVIAMLADSVPAVQALGQCIFLPMLMLGGVAVPLARLPDWAQHLSAFFPGRYAVAAIQACASGSGLPHIGFELAALLVIGAAAGLAAIGLFRWEPDRAPPRANRLWVLLALAGWVGIGIAAELRGGSVAPEPETEAVPPPAAFIPPRVPVPAAAPITRPTTPPQRAEPTPARGWRDVTDAEIAAVAYDRLPPDSGVVSPVAGFDEVPDPAVAARLDTLRASIADWPPAAEPDPVQRARNLLCVAAVPDLYRQEGLERFVPVLVFERLRAGVPREDLARALWWVAAHPDDGSDAACRRLEPLGLPRVEGSAAPLRPRIMLYALKLLGRLTGAIVQS